MAEIASSSVFTNDAVSPSPSSSDLLQQAIQQAVDDDEDNFVAFLENDESDCQMIHLTPEQAKSLGITFEITENQEVMYKHNDANDILDTSNITENNHCKTDDVSSVSPEETAFPEEDFNFETSQVENVEEINDIAKTDCMDYSEWPIHEDAQSYKLQSVADSLTSGNICLQPINSQSQTLEIQQNTSHTQKIVVEQPKIHAIMTDIGQIKTKDNSCYVVEDDSVQNQSINKVSSSQAQIIQKLPIILPSSQFFLKPAQTILKPAKNVKLIQNINKFVNTNINSVNQLPTINISSNSNSVLLSKATLINTLSPQIIKATPITTQFLNTNNVSAQLLNTSHIITGNCEIGNQTSTSQIANTVVNSAPVLSQNATTSQIRLSPAIKATSSSLQKNNISQLLAPMIKNAATITKTVAKPAQVISNATISTELKPIQINSKLIKASSLTGKKSLITPMTKIITQTNSPVIFRTASIAKTQDSKTTSNSTSILKPTQTLSTPISILKPQNKAALHNYTKNQTVTINPSNIINNITNFLKTTPIIQQNGSSEKTESFQNGFLKQKIVNAPSVNGACSKINKKSKGIPSTKSTNPETIDTSKPLGSSENPIQIVQQGHHFRSTQQLSPNCLKKIFNIINQRNQLEETSMSDKKIVYRVLLPEELASNLNNPGTLIKNRGGKRGRPKKNAIRPSLIPSKTATIL